MSERIQSLVIGLGLLGVGFFVGSKTTSPVCPPVDPEMPGISLASANLSNSYMPNSDFSNANLTTGNFIGATLYEADLSSADMRNARLVGADLSGALLGVAERPPDLSMDDLTDDRDFGAVRATPERTLELLLELSRGVSANLSRADLRRVNLREADLRGADFTGARLEGAIGLP